MLVHQQFVINRTWIFLFQKYKQELELTVLMTGNEYKIKTISQVLQYIDYK